MAQEKIEWEDPWLKAQDLEFHQIDPARSLGLALDQPPAAWNLTPKILEASIMEPPANTRAHARSGVMRLLKEFAPPYSIDWEIVGVEGINPLNLLNPFDPAPPELKTWNAEFNAAMKGLPRKEKQD
jgi:proteasome accessory factor A